jgi:hypothetical protein
MKRRQLLKHLRAHGCVFLREGSRHSWWLNPQSNRHSSIPRHAELTDQLARKICKDLAIPFVKRDARQDDRAS